MPQRITIDRNREQAEQPGLDPKVRRALLKNAGNKLSKTTIAALVLVVVLAALAVVYVLNH